jgi:hypothetical protein
VLPGLRRAAYALGESSAELVSPATDRLVRDLDATLKQQLLDVAHAQTQPEIPVNRATDDDGREAVTVIKRFRFLRHFILPPTPHQPDRALRNGATAQTGDVRTLSALSIVDQGSNDRNLNI